VTDQTTTPEPAQAEAVAEFFRAVAQGSDPTAPAGRFAVFSGHLVTTTASCTCAGGGEWPHEEYCGLEPVASLAEIVAALYETNRLTPAKKSDR
jgi:hypothetical protein